MACSNPDGREFHVGDLNLDGRVSALDLNVVSNRWQQRAAVWTEGDLNGDGFVNVDDLNAVGKNWSPLAALASSVPELGSLWLAAGATKFFRNGLRKSVLHAWRRGELTRNEAATSHLQDSRSRRKM